MHLSDVDIRNALASGKVNILPKIDLRDIRPTGLRLHLANVIAQPEATDEIIELSGTCKPIYRQIELNAEGIVLAPGDFILASTVEQISTTPDIITMLDGRSTLARLGIQIHCGSMVIDNVHEEPRSITLEIANLGPFKVRLKSGDRIGMIFFSSLHSAIGQRASKQYRGQQRVTPPIFRQAS